MYIFDLQAKLQKIHPDLYVKTDIVNHMHCGLVSSGIYLKNPKRSKDTTGSGKNLIIAVQRRYLEAMETGQLDKFVMGICLNYIPEYDVYDLERERVLMPGWRTVAVRLARANIASLDKLKKVFKCRSLGETDWDNANLYERIRKAKGMQDA